MGRKRNIYISNLKNMHVIYFDVPQDRDGV